MADGEETRRFEDLLRKRGTEKHDDSEEEKEIERRYRKDCAVLVLDSSGFTRITKKHGVIHFLSLVVSMRDMVSVVVKANKAELCWAAADNVYAVFPRAADAVRAGLQIQRTVEAENLRRAEESRLRVCIGIGSGRMLCIGEENVYGDQMNLASKLGEDIAEPGEVLITDSVRGRIAEEMGHLKMEERGIALSGVSIKYYSILDPAGSASSA